METAAPAAIGAEAAARIRTLSGNNGSKCTNNSNSTGSTSNTPTNGAITGNRTIKAISPVPRLSVLNSLPARLHRHRRLRPPNRRNPTIQRRRLTWKAPTRNSWPETRTLLRASRILSGSVTFSTFLAPQRINTLSYPIHRLTNIWTA